MREVASPYAMHAMPQRSDSAVSLKTVLFPIVSFDAQSPTPTRSQPTRSQMESDWEGVVKIGNLTINKFFRIFFIFIL